MDDLKERNDLIRRGDAIDLCEMAIDDSWEYDYATDRMFEIPAVDAVEVCRCRECRHNCQPPDKGFAQCELDALIREPEFWCRAGQRREEERNAVD